MKTTEIQWEILEDGTISITTDDLAGPNHHAADELLKQLAEATGGPVTTKKRSRFGLAAHKHSHDHTHTH